MLMLHHVYVVLCLSITDVRNRTYLSCCPPSVQRYKSELSLHSASLQKCPGVDSLLLERIRISRKQAAIFASFFSADLQVISRSR